MTTSTRSNRFVGRARLLVAAVFTLCAAFAIQAGAAQAEQLKLTFNDGRINLGDNKGLPMIDPTATPPDAPAVLTADINPGTGAFTAPPSGLSFPQKTFENIETGIIDVDVVADFSAIGQISGNFNEATGVLSTQALNVRALLSVYPAGDPTLLMRCRIEPVPLPIASTGEIVDDTDEENPITYEAAPFAPPSGQGAGVATWATLPSSVFDGGAADLCSEIDGLAGGPGGMWLSGTAEVSPSPAALALVVQPKARSVRVGKMARFTARVRNTGQLPATGVRVCVKAPKPLRGKRCRQIGSIAGGATVARRFALRATKRAAAKGKKRIRRHVLRFNATSSNAGGATARANLRVIKPKRKRRR